MNNLLVKALRDYHNTFATPNVWKHSIFGQAAELIEQQAAELTALREATRWIPLSERLPEYASIVLALVKGIAYECEFYKATGGIVDTWVTTGEPHRLFYDKDVSHWMHRAAASKEEI